MDDVKAAMAKLAGVRKVVTGLLTERVVSHPRQPGMPRTQFAPTAVGHYFNQTANIIERLRELLADLYGDFQQIAVEPTLQVYVSGQTQYVYGREQIEQLGRDIDQVFEIRSNSELSQPAAAQPAAEPKRVFISHGRANDWREVQAYIEKDIGLATLELAQEPSAGQTIIEKLERNASSCDSAVIVMTGDDMDDAGKARVRENASCTR